MNGPPAEFSPIVEYIVVARQRSVALARLLLAGSIGAERTAAVEHPRLTPAIERALELMRSGMRPPLANTLAAREFNLPVRQIAQRTGAIASDARLNRKARRKAQERQP